MRDSFKRRLLDIRLIDVHNRKIIKGDSDLNYAALSYVWGVKSQSMSNTDGQDGSGVDHLPAALPSTIEDAMVFTRDLGLDYLWIDR